MGPTAMRVATKNLTQVARGSAHRSHQKSVTRAFTVDSIGAGRSLPVNLGVRVVPQQSAWIVERFGKFHKVLAPGINFLIPVVDKISYVHSLKEQAMTVPNQQAITKDNVSLTIDGVLYVRIVDPYKASYGVQDAMYAVLQMAQTTMRSELGKMSLDKTFEEREKLNSKIVLAINEAAEVWGVQCMRYEIRDIIPSASVKSVIDMEAEAERRKRAQILDSEGEREAEVNIALGMKQASVMKAEGEAAAIELKAKATAAGVKALAAAVQSSGGSDAVQLRLAEQYISAFGEIARKGNTMLLPMDAANPAAMIAQAMAVYKSTSGDTPGPATKTMMDSESIEDLDDDRQAIHEESGSDYDNTGKF